VGNGNGALAWQRVQSRHRDRPRGGEAAPDDALVFGGSKDGDARSDTFIGPEEPVDTGVRH
jgi:hypothetical protein